MSTTHVIYNSQRIIPSPFVTINKVYNKTGDGEIIGKTYSITVTGTLVAWKGSPNSSGTFWTLGGYPPDETISHDARLGAILRKQEALRELFSVEGQSFEIQSADASQPMKCNPRIISIEFPEGTWYETCPYTIQLEADELYPMQEDSLPFFLSDAEESWQIEVDEEHMESLLYPQSYRLTHSINATGKRSYDETGTLIKDAWEHARDYANSRMSITSSLLPGSYVYFNGSQHLPGFSGVSWPSYYGGYNRVVNENIGKTLGNYQITESWILTSGTAFEEFNISTTESSEDPYSRVTIDGTITGLEERDSNNSLVVDKYTNAVTKFGSASGLAYTRCQLYSGLNLNLIPLTSTIGRSPLGGTITYSFEYNDRPSKLIPGTKSEVISVGNNTDGRSFASIFVLGREAGPILQDLGTKQALTRTLNIELVMNKTVTSGNSVNDIYNVLIGKDPYVDPDVSGYIRNVIDAVNPSRQGFSTVFQDQIQRNWDALNSRFSLNTGWTYE